MESNAVCDSTNVTTFINYFNITPTTIATTIPTSIFPNSADGASDSDANDNDGTVVDEQGSNTKKQRGSNWTNEEDLKLVNAWYGIFMDSARGAKHKEQGLWEHVLKAFVSTGNPKSRD